MIMSIKGEPYVNFIIINNPSMNCEATNPEVKTPYCIKTRSQYRQSQQSNAKDAHTETNSPAKEKNLSQESIAAVMEIPSNFEVEQISTLAQPRATDVLPATEFDNGECLEVQELPSGADDTEKLVTPKMASCASSKKRTFAEITGGADFEQPIATKTRKLESGNVSVKASKTSVKEVTEALSAVSLVEPVQANPAETEQAVVAVNEPAASETVTEIVAQVVETDAVALIEPVAEVQIVAVVEPAAVIESVPEAVEPLEVAVVEPIAETAQIPTAVAEVVITEAEQADEAPEEAPAE